jgi:Xaa-Pro aminopeptidase
MAFTMLLIIATGYLSYLYLTSNFNLNWILFSILGTIAIAIGIIAPKFSIIILSSVQSVIHLMIQWDYLKSSYWFLMLIITGILIQSADYFVFSKSYKTPTLGHKERKERLPKELKLPIAVSTIIILTAFICLSLFSPRLEPVNDYYLNKFENISNAAIFNRPTIITNAEYNFYLYGRAVPISFISKNKSFVDRIKNIFIGRDICQDLKKFRVIKDEIEIGKIKKACEITSNAMKEAAKLIKPGINEKEIEEAILNKFKEQGVKRVAFKSIVASGKNALLPHYDKNNATLKNGFVVVDIGCMVDGYASDMTRTFPVMGKYNEGELELIQLVNKAKETAVKNLKPGVSIKDLNNKAKSIFEAKGLGKYYLHSLSHHVGINVHDPSEDILKPGMVITVEPGIYINEAAGIDKKYWNLGIRIEDTYLITKDGAIQLTNYPQIPFL